jgi:hypothetical protein
MHYKINFLFVCLFFLLNNVSSQTIYGVTDWRLRSIDIKSCSNKVICDFGNDHELLTSAFHPDGRLFASMFIPKEGKSYIVQIDTALCSFMKIITFDTPLGSNNFRVTGMVFDENGLLYMGHESGLKIFNLNNNDLINKGEFNLFLADLEDLVFYNGRLFANAGRFLRYGLLEININNPTMSAWYSFLEGNEIDNNYLFANGLTLINENCNKIFYSSSSNDNTNSFITIYNITSNQHINKCRFSFKLDGLTYPTEAFADKQSCTVTLDLDKDNSTGATDKDYQYCISCSNTKSSNIIDTDFTLETPSGLAIDSIELTIQNYTKDDVLQMPASPFGFIINKKNDSTFVLNPIGKQSDYSYGEILKKINYVYSGTQFDISRKIIIKAYSQGNITQAVATINIKSKSFAGRDTTLQTCLNSTISDINTILKTDQGGTWSPPFVSGTDTYDSNKDKPGTYSYILQDSGCGADTAFVTITTKPLQQLDKKVFICIDATYNYKGKNYAIGDIYQDTLAGKECDTALTVAVLGYDQEIRLDVKDTTICGNNALKIDLSALPYVVTWSDGGNEKMKTLSSEDLYFYEYIDKNGCQVIDDFRLSVSSSPQKIKIDTTLCQDEVVKISTKIFSQKGIYKWIDSIGQCPVRDYELKLDYYKDTPIKIVGDSVLCDQTLITLSVNKTQGIKTWREINDGGTTIKLLGNSDSVKIDKASLIELTYTDTTTNCSQKERVKVRIGENSKIIINDALNQEWARDFKIPVRYEGSINQYTWSPSTNLSCMDCAYPTLLQPLSDLYKISVKSKDGCITEDSIKVSFIDNKIYVPNIIKATQSFFAQGNSSNQYAMTIYNRWGNIMYQKNDLIVNDDSASWSPGNEIESGVYIYNIKYNGRNITGTITLVK